MSKKYALPDWNIGSSPLGCGITVLQGWSEGIGIHGNEGNAFGDKFFDLLYFSLLGTNYAKMAELNKFGITPYGTKSLGGESLAPKIGVGVNRFQFLTPKHLTLVASKDTWIKKFRDFVAEHNLGQFSNTDGYSNIRHTGSPCAAGLFVWNGNLPSGGRFDTRKAELDAVLASSVDMPKKVKTL